MAAAANPPKDNAALQRQEGRHVTPKWELQSYRAVTLRERESNQRHAARDRANTGVYVFTCVNVYGISS